MIRDPNRPANLKRSARRDYVVIALAASAGIIMSLVMLSYGQSAEEERARLDFERRAADLMSALRATVDSELEVLRSVEALYTASRGVTRTEFRTFVAPALSRHPDVQGISWNPRVPAAQRAAFERAAQQAGYPNFQFTERNTQSQLVTAGQRPEYVVVYYIEPYRGNETALGYDVSSDPVRAAALALARDTGNPAATGRIRLVQETGAQYSVLVFVPVYDNGAQHTTVPERRANLSGYVVGVLRISDIVDTALQGLAPEDVEVELYDVMAPADESRLYSNADTIVPSDMSWEASLYMADRQWQVVFRPSSGAQLRAAQYAWQIWAAPVAALLFTALLSAYLFARTRNTAKMEQALAELRQSHDDLQARNEELDAFAHTVAHDLKSPLSLIVGYVEILQESEPAPIGAERRKYLDIILQTGRKISAITDALLLLSKVHKAEVDMEPLDMAKIVNNARDRLADLIEQVQAAIIIPAAWPMSFGHAPWVEEVWVNYISNALKYGGRPPRVELSALQQPDGVVKFMVCDNGAGLTPDEQARLFTPFTQLAQTSAAGHGLGLSIVQRIVKKLGGQVSVESELGHGSVFSFTLPSKPERVPRALEATTERR